MNVKVLQPVGHWALIALVGLFILSCKKDAPEPEPEPEPVDRTESQLIKDDIYKYYKLYSLWDTSIPDYTENPAEFTDKYRSADDVLTALKKLTPVHAAYDGGVLDRFSFMEGINGYNTGTSARNGLKMDNNDGYGLYFSFGTEDGKIAYPIIYFVEGGSPAQKAGLKRSDYVISVNNDTDYSFSVTCDDRDCTYNESDKNRIENKLDAALDAGTLKLQVKQQDGKVLTKSLTYSNYTIDPIYKDTVYLNSGNNVGYLALSSFEEIENNNLNQQQMDAVFKKFEDAQIQSLIVDLRYNGGGYVDASAYVADKIGGSKTRGKLMLSYEVNAYIKKTPSVNKMFQDTKFTGLSALNLNKVYFLVSDKTASAAEMLINVLKPHLSVQIIASETRTFGKPVGFFEQVVQDKVSFWPVSFLLKNSAGFSDYWDGLVPDKPNIEDYIFVDVGDKRETMLETALNDAAPSSSTRAALQSVSSKMRHRLGAGTVNAPRDRGMIKKFKE
ncbi:hypothetical protein HX021_16880 [Sphingobacterium sp. N143]|uniref:S41 family peptidase n=1 Tax=Sphingobacterium sp. N143 TaxID=2746727 RepID=UPI002577A8F5|nr:S41 family peptidase [Sphingobacterium sp. N143]MDM1295968.1 hypothetical protein [Sphingobacterium sp. N143]